jgi:GNAT superfamily N-acetyltransferase
MFNNNLTVRDACEGDASSISALLSELGHPTEAPDVPTRLARLRLEGGAALLVVDGEDMAQGFMSLAMHAVLHASGPVALITALVVREAARGRGVGRRLVVAATEWARSRGCVRLTVTSGEARADAHAFYPACGLVYTGRRFTVSLIDPP